MNMKSGQLDLVHKFPTTGMLQTVDMNFMQKFTPTSLLQAVSCIYYINSHQLDYYKWRRAFGTQIPTNMT